jgi:hypothetical protein
MSEGQGWIKESSISGKKETNEKSKSFGFSIKTTQVNTDVRAHWSKQRSHHVRPSKKGSGNTNDLFEVAGIMDEIRDWSQCMSYEDCHLFRRRGPHLRMRRKPHIEGYSLSFCPRESTDRETGANRSSTQKNPPWSVSIILIRTSVNLCTLQQSFPRPTVIFPMLGAVCPVMVIR